MYEQLKQIMREAGYEVSKGAEWLASDMQHFATFSRQVLGSTTPHLNHMLAYPGAFPHVIAKAEELAKGVVNTIEHAIEDIVKAVEPAAPVQTPVAEASPVEAPPVSAAQPDSSILDVSAAGQTDKQDLSATPPVAQEPAPAQEQPTEQPTEQPQRAAPAAEGTEPAVAEGAGQAAAEGTEQPAEGQSNEGQPQE